MHQTEKEQDLFEAMQYQTVIPTHPSQEARRWEEKYPAQYAFRAFL